MIATQGQSYLSLAVECVDKSLVLSELDLEVSWEVGDDGELLVMLGSLVASELDVLWAVGHLWLLSA